MQDYKRIVSYIYAYENNQKKNNVGFAKLEAKDGMGRLTFQINAKGSFEDGGLEVYFLHIGKLHEGIKVGEGLFIKNGRINAELKVNTANIADTGLDLSAIQGLYFCTKTEPKKIFASSWINDALNLQTFREYKAEDVEAAPPVIIEENAKVEEAVEDKHETVDEIVEEVPEKVEVAEEKPEMGKNELIKTFFDELEKLEKQEKEETFEETPAAETVEAESVSCACSESKEKSLWEQLCCKYPKVIAFENNTCRICLKIDVKDMENIFGRECRVMPNTFAIRSYMRYHYLLLIENEKDSEGKSCILGVPGIFNNNDNIVANMCGFNEFMPSKNVDKKNNCFGYWGKVVKL